MQADDPFRHHPGLRGLITDPSDSFFRSFHPGAVDALMAEHGLPNDWRFSEDAIEAMRREALAGRAGDLWVFAYGSLMWDPGVPFAEVRRARIHGYARSFILVDRLGARGLPERPGVMAALDAGANCDGLAFRLAAETVEETSRRIWWREMIGPGYRPAFLPAETDLGSIEVVTFVADHAAPPIEPDLPHETMVRYAATGRGFLGSSLDYLENLARHFDELGIEDATVARLLSEARALRAADRTAGG
jgi:cation transport protein ChaC